MAETAAVDQIEPVAQHPKQWPHFQRLNELLRSAGFCASPDRWQNAHDLLLDLAAQGRMPDNLLELRPLLAPLFCRSAREQAHFKTLFAQWLAAVQPATPTGLEQPAETAKKSQVCETVSPPKLPWRTILIASLLGFVVVLGAAYGYWVYYWQGQLKPPLIPANPPPVLTAPVVQPTPDTANLTLQTIPPRRPPEQPSLDPGFFPVLDLAGTVLMLLPALVGLSFLILRWMAWQTVLQRRSTQNKADQHDPLHAITLAAGRDDLLDAPLLRASLRRLHAPVAYETRRLHAAATVHATAHNAGLFQPVFQQRLMVPELVVLVDYHHGADQMAALAQLACDRLAAAGLRVHRYRYQHDPSRVRAETGTAQWRYLADVAALHPGSRLLLIGEPAVLIDPWSQALRRWADVLALWPQRGLLATRLPPTQWAQVLRAGGMLVADLSSEGLARLAEHFSGAPPLAALAPTTAPLPELLQDNEIWLASDAPGPPQQHQLLRELQQYLGEQGCLLFAALAGYPSVHWGLIRALDLILFSDTDSQNRERRLLRIARLPWCREGWLPEWLRQLARDAQPPAQRRRIADIYQQLLGRATIDGLGDIQLPFELPTGTLQRWWRWQRLRRWLNLQRDLSPQQGVLQDRIFAQTLLGRYRNLIDLLLPEALARQLPDERWRLLLPRMALVAIIAVAGGGLLLQAWHQWGRDSTQQQLLLNAQLGAHARYTVNILHIAETVQLAQALSDTLQLHGFQPPHLQAITPKSQTALNRDGVPPAPQPTLDTIADNTVQVGKKEDAPTADYVAQRLAYLTWGLEPQVANRPTGLAAQFNGPHQAPKPGELRVWLLTPGRSGSGFTDTLAVSLSAPQLKQLGVPFNSEPSIATASAADTQPSAQQQQQQQQQKQQTVTPPPLPSFSDALREGGQGPDMVKLPAGTFLMSSPQDEPERSKNEGPQRQVSIAAFAMGRTEVTFDDYDRFAKATDRKLPKDYGWGRGQRPVVNVSWQDARDYAAWLSEQTGHHYRLPSEAEWEYAARAGTTTPFSTGDCIDTGQANYNRNYDYNNCGANTGLYREKTVPAASLPANAWGLHEMHGNVWEWTRDCWFDNYEGAPLDGSAREAPSGVDCPRRVFRGGGWYNGPGGLRSAGRAGFRPVDAGSSLGFRLARTL